MAMMRMSMGQKASAKNITKVAFSGPDGDGGRVSAVSSGSAGQDAGRPSDRSAVVQMNSAATGSRLPHAATSSRLSFLQTSQSRSHEDLGESQIQALNTKINLLSELPPNEVENKWMRRFNLGMGLVICLNIVVIALQTDLGYDEEGPLEDKIGWIIIDSLFLLVFLIELGVRMHVERRAWFWSLWNWFDLLIVLLAIVDVWVITAVSGDANLYVLSIFRIFRLVRLVRLVKLVRLLQGLYAILMAFWHAMQTMSFLLVLMLFGLLIYAVFAVNLIGRNSTLRDVRINGDTVYDRFGTVYRSMYSLFELMTLEGWESVARPIVEAAPFLFIFIVSFIMIFTFGMLNMVVALVIEKTLLYTRMMNDNNQQHDRLQMVDELIKVKALFSNGNPESVGRITYEEFRTGLRESAAVQNLFEQMGISPGDVKELYTVLDWDESGDLTVKEFLEGLQKLQESAASPWDVLAAHATVRDVRKHVLMVEEKVERLVGMADEQATSRRSLEARLQAQDEKLKEVLRRLDTLVDQRGRQ